MTGILDSLTTVDAVRRRVDAAVDAAFLAATAARSRPPHAFSMSRLGMCTRAAAFTVAGTPVSDKPPPDQGRAANLGTWEHDGFLPYLAAELGIDATVEDPVVLHAGGLVIPGRADLTFIHALGELKTTGEHRIHKVRRRGRAYSDHWIQDMGYSLGRRQAGHEVRWVTWIYMDRATGDHTTFVEEFDDTAALAVIDRVREIRRWAEADPNQAPREGYAIPGFDPRGHRYVGPGLGEPACDGCHWLRRCWGPTATPGVVGAQRLPAHDKPAVAAALAQYVEASMTAAEARREQEFFKAQLAGNPIGVYGPLSLLYSGAGSRIDNEAVRRRYAELGEEVPTVPTGRSLRVHYEKDLTAKQRQELGLPPR